MRMVAMILNAEVQESTFYDQMTGVPRQGHSVKLTVLDTGTDEKYECQFSGGFPQLEELKQLRQQNGAPEQIADAVTRLRQSLPQKYAQYDIEVVRIKGKGSFLTLVCRFPQAAEAAA